MVQKGDKRVEARSLLGLLTLAAEPGNELQVFIDGEDAEETSNALRKFFEEEVGEINPETST
jgi:phosphotransferase system HPr (HPr) family protein